MLQLMVPLMLPLMLLLSAMLLLLLILLLMLPLMRTLMLPQTTLLTLLMMPPKYSRCDTAPDAAPGSSTDAVALMLPL